MNYWEEINKILDDYVVKNPWLKQLIQLIRTDAFLSKGFQCCCASVKWHHTHSDGLVKHTHEMLQLAINMYFSERSAFSNDCRQIDKELLLTVIFLHDVGKIQTYYKDDEGEFGKTDIGVSLEHTVIGLVTVDKFIDQIPDFPNHLRFKILHCIASHHGRKEWGAPVEPVSTEAKILHHLDMISAQVMS